MKTIRLHITKAENGYVVHVAPEYEGSMWESVWVAEDLKHLGEVICTQLVVKEFGGKEE